MWTQVQKEVSPATAPWSIWQKLCLLWDTDLTALAYSSSPNDDVLQLAVKTVQMFSLVLATVLLGKVHYV